MMFGGQNIISILDNLRGQEFQFVSRPLTPTCPVLITILKSNTVELKLSCTILYFLADQTHL
jgi:hypothetical protein